MMTSVLFSSAAGSLAPVPPVQSAIPSERVHAFENAMARHAPDAQAAEPGRVAAGRPTATAETGQTDFDAQSRARRGLGLDEAPSPVKAAEPAGDMILNGLQHLRGVFDAREARLSEVMHSSGTDAKSLMAMQMEMTNFTLLVDMSSKLTGKTTQVFETLMKGQ